MKMQFSFKTCDKCHNWCQNYVTNVIIDAHKHMRLSMCWKTTDSKEKCLEICFHNRFKIKSNEAQHKFCWRQGLYTISNCLFGIGRLPKNKFIREEYFVGFTGCSVFWVKFSVVMTTGCSFVIASVEWKGGQAGLERDGGGAHGLAHWGRRVI